VNVNLSIKAVPEALAERLRQRAERNHRSLQGELMAIIERAAYGADDPPDSGSALASRRLAFTSRGSRSIEQIAMERRLRPLNASPDLPRAVDIVREARDTRGDRGAS
jgi:plasmid stability protein